jgi:predicted ATPase
LEANRATGQELNQSYGLAILAEAYGQAGRYEAGLTAVTEALMAVNNMEERWCEAELHRLQGELLLQLSSDNHTEAESCYQKAITIAQNQSAKSWELRATTSLSRLQKQQGKREEARQLLSEIYGWFTEGFDTADLKDAKALLDELA